MDFKKLEPFVISKKISENNYELSLPKNNANSPYLLYLFIRTYTEISTIPEKMNRDSLEPGIRDQGHLQRTTKKTREAVPHQMEGIRF